MIEGVYRASEEKEFLTTEGCHILELSNAPQDASLSIARARVTPGVTTRPHRLHGVDERYIILKGTGRVTVGGKSADLAPGDLVQIPPGVVQSIANTGHEDLVFLCVCTPPFTPACYEELGDDPNV